jgi:hypothetical protein
MTEMNACVDFKKPLNTTGFSSMLQVPGQDQRIYASTNRGVLRLNLVTAKYSYIALSAGPVTAMSSDFNVNGELHACASVCCVASLSVCFCCDQV